MPFWESFAAPQGFKEDDKPNFTGSYYSHCKAITENLLQAYPGVLTLRVRMPIVADLTYERNFITKIIKYDKVINIPNSMTVLPELIPYSIEMAKRKLTGIMNYTNPGAISHNEILELYKQYIDPDFKWCAFCVAVNVQALHLGRGWLSILPVVFLFHMTWAKGRGDCCVYLQLPLWVGLALRSMLRAMFMIMLHSANSCRTLRFWLVEPLLVLSLSSVGPQLGSEPFSDHSELSAHHM